MILFSVKGRNAVNDCFMPYATRAVIFSSNLIEVAVLVVFGFVLRRLRKSKVLGLHKHASVGERKKFLDEDGQGD
jgi:hypothetical protein